MATQVPDQGVSFKDTLNLPETAFPLTPTHAIDDVRMIERWNAENLWVRSFEHNSGNEKFILHDGPPYANGPIHLGHAYNKIAKDIVGKSQRMSGKQVPITPGWDCHGLPIEQKVSKELPAGLSPATIRKECRLYAQKWVEVQKEQFKKLGVLMNWDKPYLTMDASYEAATIRAFGQFFQQGYVEKKLKTVPWCPTDQTVLATAEIEYQDQKDPSVYVLFSLPVEMVRQIAPTLADRPLHAVIWTTTPWTLPLNRAILVKPDAEYDIIDYNGQYLLVGSALSAQLASLLEIEKKVVATVQGESLVGLELEHPFLQRRTPLISDPMVANNEGTAFVHCAPGCGPHDYDIAVQHNLEIYSPISTDGKYTRGIEPEELEGMSVADGQIWVMRKLNERNKMLLKKSITHAYPHCWRCHQKLIFRATNQWFLNLSHDNLRQRALEAIEQINFLPPNSRGFLKATVEGRLEWCVSRQRVWGVPIPAVICTTCQWTYTSAELIDRVAQGAEKRGIDYWQEATFEELGLTSLRCQKCYGTEFLKEHDILDVWFEAGVSHYAVLMNNKELSFPADLYLEGLDQHRGWFQSSLLTAMVLEREAPMKSLLTHGFAVDEKGHKMSKSLGNVVSPDEIIAQLGTDGLRLWAASIDYGGDAIVSKALLNNIGQVYRKIRNTCRFLLANLSDFDYSKNAVVLDKLLLIDRYALHELYAVNADIISAYKACDFTAVYHRLTDYCTVSLSSLYLDIIKDRLYTAASTGHERRSAQTVCYLILDTLTKLIAPIMSFAAEQISDFYQKDKKTSIHLQSFNALNDIWRTLIAPKTAQEIPVASYPYVSGVQLAKEAIKATSYAFGPHQTWNLLLEIRSAGLKAIEGLRQQGIIKHSLEAQIILAYKPTSQQAAEQWRSVRDDLASSNQTMEQFLKELFIVSQCTVTSDATGLQETNVPGLSVAVARAEGVKCPRCWQWSISKNQYSLCSRCEPIVSRQQK